MDRRASTTGLRPVIAGQPLHQPRLLRAALFLPSAAMGCRRAHPVIGVWLLSGAAQQSDIADNAARAIQRQLLFAAWLATS